MSARRDPDPARLLARALVASAAAAGCDAQIVEATVRGWASATFVGTRHLLVVAVAASIDRYRWLAGLAEADLPIARHVALPPAILAADDARVTLEVIVLEDH